MDKSLIRRIQELETGVQQRETLVQLCHYDADVDEVRLEAERKYPGKQVIVVQCWWKPQYPFDTIRGT